MEIRHGLISADSHVVTEPNAFPDRTSKSRFGERIPQIKEVESKGAKSQRGGFLPGWPLGKSRRGGHARQCWLTTGTTR